MTQKHHAPVLVILQGGSGMRSLNHMLTGYRVVQKHDSFVSPHTESLKNFIPPVFRNTGCVKNIIPSRPKDCEPRGLFHVTGWFKKFIPALGNSYRVAQKLYSAFFLAIQGVSETLSRHERRTVIRRPCYPLQGGSKRLSVL